MFCRWSGAENVADLYLPSWGVFQEKRRRTRAKIMLDCCRVGQASRCEDRPVQKSADHWSISPYWKLRRHQRYQPHPGNRPRLQTKTLGKHCKRSQEHPQTLKKVGVLLRHWEGVNESVDHHKGKDRIRPREEIITVIQVRQGQEKQRNRVREKGKGHRHSAHASVHPCRQPFIFIAPQEGTIRHLQGSGTSDEGNPRGVKGHHGEKRLDWKLKLSDDVAISQSEGLEAQHWYQTWLLVQC